MMIHQISIEHSEGCNDIHAEGMKVGQIGVITEGEHEGLHIMRTYDQLVSLERPSATWSNPRGCGLRVKVLPAGDVVRLKLGA